ncbi:MFS transporter [Phreatobacter stygius]|uniref:MFS transporter n=1 Tax=Phreatobacter stygius TaxID=1940610 RepID=A0A4D7AUK0_9HYPH|nr:MFS transporter [Phreatobacter stygius]QCI64549.1 MFS transporter [Phreatobacter stygius]
MSTISVGARLDRLPVSNVHRKIFTLVAIGMFFEGFDIYLAASVLGSTLRSNFSTIAQNGLFISATFVGMMLGAFLAGFLGDRYGRKRTYQWNLVVFGVAAILSAFAPNMETLIGLRFLMGLGLGAEVVVGYSVITEFVPPSVRGRWSGMIATIVTAGLPASALMAWLLIPSYGWRVMFIIGGCGALIAWALRNGLPESPRWLESVGRQAEAEAIIADIERQASNGQPLPPPQPTPAPLAGARDLSALARSPFLARMVVGCVSLIVVNTLIYGFISWLPTFFISQGQDVTRSFGFSLLMALGGPIGSTIGAFAADPIGRKKTIIGAAALAIILAALFPLASDPLLVAALGFLLTVPIYILVALLFGIYIPELFPTELRLRAVGICNTAGRSASIIVPLVVGPLFLAYGVTGVLTLMGAALAIMIVVVATLGIEPERKGLEAVTNLA